MRVGDIVVDESWDIVILLLLLLLLLNIVIITTKQPIIISTIRTNLRVGNSGEKTLEVCWQVPEWRLGNSGQVYVACITRKKCVAQ